MFPTDCRAGDLLLDSDYAVLVEVRDRARPARRGGDVCHLVTGEAQFEMSTGMRYENGSLTRDSTCCVNSECVLYSSLSVMLIDKSFLDSAIYWSSCERTCQSVGARGRL